MAQGKRHVEGRSPPVRHLVVEEEERARRRHEDVLGAVVAVDQADPGPAEPVSKFAEFASELWVPRGRVVQIRLDAQLGEERRVRELQGQRRRPRRPRVDPAEQQAGRVCDVLAHLPTHQVSLPGLGARRGAVHHEGVGFGYNPHDLGHGPWHQPFEHLGAARLDGDRSGRESHVTATRSRGSACLIT